MHRRLLLWVCLTVSMDLATVCQAESDQPQQQVRVLSYNIHHGEGTDGKIDLERIAKVIRSVQPDLVALQEVDRNTRRSGGIDQPTELARLTGLKVVFERNIEYQGGDYGNAVLSRVPIERHKNHALPSHYKGEQRGVLELELKAPGGVGPFVFMATHLDYRPDDGERQASAVKIDDLLKSQPETPAILAGDLNANPDSEVLKFFSRNWQVARGNKPTTTFPSSEPTKQIDYVLFRTAEHWKVIDVRVLDEPIASDHRPILAVLERRSGKNNKCIAN